MKLPTKFEEILKNDQGLNGVVHSTLSTFEEVLRQNHLPFFPEYTDHSNRHVEEVLTATQALIRDEAWDVISPEDVAVLSLAVLVHDAGMHLSEDGFIRLVSADTPWPAPHSADSPSWTQLWSDFLGEASRFDARKLKQLFGDDRPVRKPPLDVQEMTRRDRMLIGEFLRRHHPSLAREIALNGVPGPHNDMLTFQNVPEDIAYLAGLVAHSHGVSLRDAAEWLKPEQRRTTQGAHVPFLMALLRIADYLQIQQERAPTEVLRVRSLRSPISQGEWNAHNAVKDIDNSQDDIEAIYIHAEPEDVKTFLKLKNLFSSIQHELDTSWAVLGEVYAIHPKLSSFGLNGLVIRRVRSNLDKVQEFGETVPYIPEKVSLQTATVELINLLIKPLYGDSPRYGMRELLQNAIDACRELDDYRKQMNPQSDPLQQETHVEIELYTDDKGMKWFSICDRGIGMTLQTIKEYFLTTGASFRTSSTWIQQHTTEDGHPKILRSGRFGIGALAAFLIGSRIYVTTRHIAQSQDKAIQFEFEVSDSNIELYATSAEVGTSIKIPITNENFQELEFCIHDWQWYYFDYPSVKFFVEGEELALSHYSYFPNEFEGLPQNWKFFPYSEHMSVHWSWEELASQDLHDVKVTVCNGLYVEDAPRELRLDTSSFFHLKGTQISIFDKNGDLPVNLVRNEIQFYPFASKLKEEVVRDLVKQLLYDETINLHTSIEVASASGSYTQFLYTAPSHEDSFTIPWLLAGREGYILADKHLINYLGFKKILLTSKLDFRLREELQLSAGSETLLVETYELDEWATHRAISKIHNSDFIVGARILVPYEKLEELQELLKYHEKVDLKDGKRYGDQIAMEIGSPGIESLDFSVLANAFLDEGFFIAELSFDNCKWSEKPSSIVTNVWKSTIGNAVIPYKMRERRRLLSHSFEMLKE